MFRLKGKYTTATVMTDDIDQETIGQIVNFIGDPSFTNPIAIMPDTHAGKGSCIGFTMPVDVDHIIPNVIGVDIGCGMLIFGVTLSSNFDKENLWKIDDHVRERIPMGYNVHTEKTKSYMTMKNIFYHAMYEINKVDVSDIFKEARKYFYTSYEEFEKEMKRRGIDLNRAELSLGTLGGGNHFIEFGTMTDEFGYKQVLCTIHTGSRHFGYELATYHQKFAESLHSFNKEEYNKKVKEIVANTSNKREIPSKIEKLRVEMNKKKHKGLDYLYGEHAMKYLCDMVIAQTYASKNRSLIAYNIFGPYYHHEQSIETVHNYIGMDGIIRKGAISAYKDEMVLIPINNSYGSLLCCGKGNKEWNYSAPHGAGRLFSRSKAKEELNIDDYRNEMEDVYCSHISEKTLDESPMAYKNPDGIIRDIEPTVTIIDRIKPILNIKNKE